MGCNESKVQDVKENHVEKDKLVTPNSKDSDFVIILDQAIDEKTTDNTDSNGSKLTKSKRSKAKKPKPPDPPKEVEAASRIPLVGHTQNVDICAWNPVQDILLTAGTDRKMFLWDFQPSVTEPRVNELQLDHSDSASCAVWSDSGKWLVSGTEHGKVILWNNLGKALDQWTPHEGMARAISVQGNKILSCGGGCVSVIDKSKRVWSRTAWNPTESIAVEWISENQFLVGDYNGLIYLDSVEDGQMKKIDENGEYSDSEPEHKYKAHSGGIYKIVRHSSRSNVFASCSVDCNINVWSVDKKSPIAILSGHFGYVVDLNWLPNADIIVSASFDGSIKIWNSRSGDCQKTLEGHHGHVTKVSSSPNGKYLVSSGHDGYCNFWSMESGELANSIEASGRLLHASFNAGGSYVAMTSYGSVEILKLQFNEKEGKLRNK
ncbi:hypothetical protein TCAL_06455 [Tigriopus californicus]|uniref:Uncharacterized protein n=1 Tax=Tigriopus californicus TaxID=6832 RepID=A0A553PLQ0_TIGCA|nr:F-box-like/WD repeat-containing protein TBL1XR1-A [Tigriopus californicus]TRY78603.1 hypothetical protein TCAL_06455 [Tigriopus californicus]